MVKEVLLPAEVWLSICEQLEKERDFQSLFNCALVKQVVASAAVQSLYRYVQTLFNSQVFILEKELFNYSSSLQVAVEGKIFNPSITCKPLFYYS